MAAVAGYGGKVMLSTTEVKRVGDWSLDVGIDMLDTTTMNDGQGGWKTCVPGLAGATGSINIKFDPADTGQTTLRQKVLSKQSAELELYEDATHKYSGTVYFSGLGAKAEVAGLVEQSVNFQFTGIVECA